MFKGGIFLEIDMKHGKPAPIIVSFAIPIIFGNIFQQLYNTVDSVIVGKFRGENALAAIGVSNPIMSIAIFLIFGICIGISVLLAQFYGAERYTDFKEEVSTSLIAGLVFTVLLSVLCYFISRPILLATKTPLEIVDSADHYLKIISVGLIFSFLYNFYSSALRAMGDSKTPFLFLVISSVTNIILDFLFVGVLGTGVEGAAVATVIAQSVSSILCIVYVYKTNYLLNLKKKQFIFKKELLSKTMQYSWTSALQQTFLYVGRLLVQSVVNPFGTSTIAAYNAALRVEALAFTPMDGLSSATSTFCAQNMGANKPDRIHSGFKSSLFLNVCYGVLTALFFLFFSTHVMKLFVDPTETDVIQIGGRYLHTMALFYIICSCMYVLQGFFRGIGKLKIPIFATASQIMIRVIFAYAFAPKFGIYGICYATAIGWLWMLLSEGTLTLQYFNNVRKQKKLQKN